MGLKRSKDGTADPMQVVSRFLDAANHHDADALRACVHHDFESIQPIHPGRNFRGSGQLVSNWKAIFEAEPGFRLTVLRSAVEDDTVWVEVHGAGDSAEAAGIFIVGVEDGRIRWIRVYSDLVEPAPEVAPTEVAPAPAAEVGPVEEVALEPAAVADGDGAVEAPETPPAVDDEPAASVADGDGAHEGRPLRLVEAADGELEADGAEDAGAATSLRLVGGEEPDGGEAPADLEGVETGELLDVPTDEAGEADETDEKAQGDEVDAGGPTAPDDDAATQAEQSGDEATAETEGDGGEGGVETPTETAVGPADAAASESEAEEVEAAPGPRTDATADGEVVETPSDEADATADATADGEVVETPSDEADAEADATADAVDIPSDLADPEADTDGEVVETPSDDTDTDAGVAADVAATSDETPSDEAVADFVETIAGGSDAEAATSTDEVGGNGDAEGDVDTFGDGAGSITSELAGGAGDYSDGATGDRPDDEEGVSTESGDGATEPLDNSSGRRSPELAEPTSPPLPRPTPAESSSTDDEQPSWRRMWRRKRGPTGS